MSKKDNQRKENLDQIYDATKNKDNEIWFPKDLYLDKIILDLSFQHSDLIKEIEDSVKAEKSIDQKFLYLDPISVKNWGALIASEEYIIYGHCLSALRKTLATPTWKESVKSEKINCIVDLGVGAGEKDNLIIKNFIRLTESKKIVQLVIIDTSIPMLELTISQLKQYLKSKKELINFYAVRTDFMKLGRSKEIIRFDKGNVVFFSLGCTFCNLDETQFLTSINNIIRSGDLLVIGVETYEPTRKEESTEEQKQVYNNDALKKLATIPLKMISEEFEDKIALSDIEIVKSNSPKYSHIKNSENIIIKDKKRDIDLAVTSRYNESDFKEFVESFGFELKDSVEATENSHYKHFIFEYQ